MSCTLNGTSPVGSEGSTNVPDPRLTGVKELSNTSMPPGGTLLAAYSRVWAPLIANPVYTAPGVVTWIKAVAPPSQAEMVPFKLAKMKCANFPSPPLLTLTGKHAVLVLLTWPVGPCAGPPPNFGIATKPLGGLMLTFVIFVSSVTL